MDSSLGCGKVCSPVFVCAVGCLASFFSACGSDRTLEFLHCDGISSGSQVVLFLGHSAGAAALLFLPCLCLRHFSLWAFGRAFVLSFFYPLAVSFLRLFLDSWLRLLSSS